MIIASFDPGKENFAGSYITFSTTRTRVSYELLHCFMVANTVKDLTNDLSGQTKRFSTEINHGVRKYRPSTMIAERFMSRGRLSGISGEVVGIMLGRMSALGIDLTVIPAASWKNAYNRVRSLDELYKEVPFVPHCMDALSIGIYHGCRLSGIKPYEFLRSDKEYSKYLKAINRLHKKVTNAKN